MGARDLLCELAGAGFSVEAAGRPAEWFIAASRATVAPLAPNNFAGANGATGATFGATEALGDDAEVI